MNPKIHYCWFGGAPKNETINKCISSWKRFFPGWSIIEWNESNFDVNCNRYVQEAYAARKWAFVSDYCRFWVLEQYGGIYFDTDVEVIRPFNSLLEYEAFAGFETDQIIAPGLVLFTREPGNKLMRETREYYDQARFLDEQGNRIRINVCGIFTNILKRHNFVPNGKLQDCDGMVLFPKDYFCPFDDATGVLHQTENTYAIHWYDKSWMSKGRIIRNRCTRVIHRIFGRDIKKKLIRLFHLK